MNPFFLTGLKTSLLFEQNRNNRCCEFNTDYAGTDRFQRVSGAISILPGQTTVPYWTEALKKSGELTSLVKGFFSKKGFMSNIRLAPFSKTSSSVKSLRVETAMTSRSSSIISSPHLDHPKLSWRDIKIPYTDFFFNILSLKVLKFARKAKV